MHTLSCDIAYQSLCYVNMKLQEKVLDTPMDKCIGLLIYVILLNVGEK